MIFQNRIEQKLKLRHPPQTPETNKSGHNRVKVEKQSDKSGQNWTKVVTRSDGQM